MSPGVPDRGGPGRRVAKVVLLLESSRASGRALLRGVANYAHVRGDWSFFWEPAGLEKAWPVLRKLDADGVILRDVGRVEEVVKLGLPAVVVGHSRTEVPGLINVVTDSLSVGRLAARHLLDCGLRHFGYCGLAESGIEATPWSRQREESFFECLGEAGYSANAFEVESGAHRTGWRRELQGLAAWLVNLPRPAGVMACNDDCGQQVIEACRLAGLQIPDDIAVLGVDNDDLISGLSNPPMSSVALNFERAGYECAEALDRLIRKQAPPARRIVVEASHVAVRHSTNLFAVEDSLVSRALRFIREESRRPVGVDEVARAVALSRRTLEKRFRSALNRSVLAEIRRMRVEHICRLLVATNRPISEIAGDLGFEGPQHVARYFRAEKGITPREFRRRSQTS
ncbi:MAG: DNA-binding transcriptional regulator [Verrucomicrobiae bacterium]|nr:DNA-binding transcriptional regulator [Verrucomicrobiae bacterium]MCP5524901.1 DNA-binding transcriptional regulator [Verrucomicrobiales bacterium]